jgi:signal transduction histidine kinase
MLDANAAFALAFGFRACRDLEAAGGLAKIFPQGLDWPALKAAGRPVAVEARTQSGRKIAPLVLLRCPPDSDDALLMLCAQSDAGETPPAQRDSDGSKDRPALAQRQFEFLAKVSHEVRTPLASIIGFADLMLGERFGPAGNPRYRAYLENIQDSGNFALKLINDLLDISKIEAGAFQIDFTSVDPREAVEAAVAAVQPFAHNARVVVRVSVASDTPKIVADAFRLRQVLLNLLSNAIKFTPERGQVVVSVGPTQDGAMRIRVRDSGVGMSASDVEIALQPFRQLDRAPRIETGTGLGLPLTKTLVEAMRGKFVILSEKGQGTTVDVIFGADRIVL